MSLKIIKDNNQPHIFNQEQPDTPQYINDLYPPIIENFDDYSNTLSKINSKIQKEDQDEIENLFIPNLKCINFFDEKPQSNTITHKFLSNLIKNPCPLSKNKITRTVSKFIKNSELIEKLSKEYQSDKKTALSELSIMCADKLSYISLKKGEILFRIGDAGDKFYIILSGCVNILKLTTKQKLMTYVEYLQYCIFLLEHNENFIFNQVITNNYKIFPLSNSEDAYTVYKIYFMKLLSQQINRKNITNNQQLKNFFKLYNQNLEDFDIKINQLNNILSSVNEETFKEWQYYLFRHCKPTTSENIFYENYEKNLLSDEKIKIYYYSYSNFLFLGPGAFFGDSALDSEFNKRNATIRIEQDAVLGFLSSDDYGNIIAPQNQNEKRKEINFLYDNFFFQKIYINNFEKNYFHLFSLHEYNRNHILFDLGNKPKCLYFIKQGQISMELHCSVMEMHYLIKYLYEKLLKNALIKKLSQKSQKMIFNHEITKTMMKYINDPILSKIKLQKDNFIREMNKIRKFDISVLTEGEMAGGEEIFLSINHILKGIVLKKLICYELSIDHIDYLLKKESRISFDYIQSYVKKIFSLINRLQEIRKNYIKIIKNKLNHEHNDFTDILFPTLQKSKSQIYELQKNTNSDIDNEYKNKNKKNNLNDEKYFIRSSLKTNGKLLRRNISQYFKSPIKHFSLSHNKILEAAFSKTKSQIKNMNSTNTSRFCFDKTKNKKNSILSYKDKKKSRASSLNNSLYNENSNNLVKIGNKYISVKKIKKEIQNFKSDDNSFQSIELIQSSKINNKNKKPLGNEQIIDKLHLSFIPINFINRSIRRQINLNKLSLIKNNNISKLKKNYFLKAKSQYDYCNSLNFKNSSVENIKNDIKLIIKSKKKEKPIISNRKKDISSEEKKDDKNYFNRNNNGVKFRKIKIKSMEKTVSIMRNIYANRGGIDALYN